MLVCLVQNQYLKYFSACLYIKWYIFYKVWIRRLQFTKQFLIAYYMLGILLCTRVKNNNFIDYTKNEQLSIY